MIPTGLPNQFLNWKLVGTDKVPCDRFGVTVDAHDPVNHLDYATAAAAGLPVAFALRDDDPWFFLDLDKCRLADGSWKPEAVAIWSSFAGAWGEVSQSGNGLHIMGYCQPAALQDRRHKWDGWLEFYTGGRFIAFGSTGWQPIGGTATNLDWTQQLLHVVPVKPFLGDLPDGRDPAYTGPDDDAALIAMMLASKAGGISAAFGGASCSVKDLWECNIPVIATKFPTFNDSDPFDRSSADAALMTHLAFWTGRDMPRMDRLFRMSALVRPKYLERDDYRTETVQKSARLCKNVYNIPPKPPSVAETDVYLNVPEMIKHFKGCVYIRDIHGVLTPDGCILNERQFRVARGGRFFQMMPDNTKPTDDAFKAFTECRVHDFPKATGTAFKPEIGPGVILPDGRVNVYVDPNVPCEPGDVSRFIWYLERLLPVPRDRLIVLSYMAAIVQNPGKKFQWAIVLQGCEGNGKTLVASCVKEAIGRQYSHEPASKKLGSQFNGYLKNKMLIIVEEIHMQGRREILDDLKPLLTNRSIEVEGKFENQVMSDNVANWIFCTNHKDAVIKSLNDRRYSIFFTAQQHVADLSAVGFTEKYFADLYRWLDAGGYAHMTHFLRTFQIDPAFNPAGDCVRAPSTSSLTEAVEQSKGVFEQEVTEAIAAGEVGFRGGWVSGYAFGRLVEHKAGGRIGRNKWNDILQSLGYEQWGRSPKIIFREQGSRPILWCKTGQGGTITDYLAAQGPGYD